MHDIALRGVKKIGNGIGMPFMRMRGKLYDYGTGVVKVLCYHGIVQERRHDRIERNLHTVSQFRQHLKILQRHRVESIDDIVNDDTPINHRRNAYAITFDDGYRNNLLAAELLQEAGLPATFFVSTSSIETGRSIWTVELSILLLACTPKTHDSMIVHGGRSWDMRTEEGRRTAFQAIRYPLNAMAAEHRIEALEELKEQYDDEHVQNMLRDYDSMHPLTWSDVQSLATAGFTIGSHGHAHEHHNAVQPDTVCIAEMTQSRNLIASHLGAAPTLFAFPNGDYDARSIHHLETTGYHAGLILEERRWNSQRGSLISRISAPGSVSSFLRHVIAS